MSEHDSFVTPNTATSSPLNDEQQAPVSDRLSAIRARLDAATPGPDGRLRRVQPTPQPWGPPLTYEVDKPDADFIAHAPADIAWLLEQVDELTKRVRMYEVVKS